MWYRLDEDDRDWISVLHHLVAAGREVDPSFAPNTAAMLADKSLSGPTRDTVVDVFIRELRTIAPYGAILIFDDFHLVDEAPDVQFIVREIVTRAPERLTIVFASRRSPGIPIAQAAGDRRGRRADHATTCGSTPRRRRGCSASRTAATSSRTSWPTSTARTEGWAASLQLVNAALRDRSPGEIRAFVRNLTGARPRPLRLPRRGSRRRPARGPADVPDADVHPADRHPGPRRGRDRSRGVGDRLASPPPPSGSRCWRGGLAAQRTELRYHPLVREFLEARLTRDFGTEAVSDAPSDRRRPRRRPRLADRRPSSLGCRRSAPAHAIIDAAAQSIIGRGDYLVAAQFVDQTSPTRICGRASRSSCRGETSSSATSARRPRPRQTRRRNRPDSDVALANLASLFVNAGDVRAALSASDTCWIETTDPVLLGIAAGTLAIVECSVDGDIAADRRATSGACRTTTEKRVTHTLRASPT